MSGRPVILLLATLLAAALWAVLKETALAIAVEVAIENFAQRVGMSRPEMISAVTPYVLALAAASAVAWVSYGIGVRDRKNKSPLEIRYSPRDPENVKPGTRPDRAMFTHYYIGIFNRTTDRTISDIEVTWDRTPFTQELDSVYRPRDDFVSTNILHRAESIDPQKTQMVHLFGLDDETRAQPDYSNIMDHASYFTVRARGRDAREVMAVFEYSPLRFPKLLRVG